MTKDEKKDMKKIAEEAKTQDDSRSAGHETKKDALPKHEEQKAVTGVSGAVQDSRHKTQDEQGSAGLETQDFGAKTSELENHLKRVQAEFENYKKRVAKEKEELGALTTAATIKRLLPVLEEFELAVNHAKDKMDEKDELLAGFEMVLKNLKSELEKQGLREMECLGEQFDPYKHEAIRSGHSELPEGKIIDVAKKGYYFKDKVLRHASVVVSKGHIAEGKTCKECG